jgi:hypothetical protein
LLVAEPVVVEDVPDAPASALPVEGPPVVLGRRGPLVCGVGAAAVVVEEEVEEDDDDDASDVEVVVVRGLCLWGGLAGVSAGGVAAGGRGEIEARFDRRSAI